MQKLLYFFTGNRLVIIFWLLLCFEIFCFFYTFNFLWIILISLYTLFSCWFIIRQKKITLSLALVIHLSVVISMGCAYLVYVDYDRLKAQVSELFIDGYIEKKEVYDNEEKDTFFEYSFIADGEKGQIFSTVIGWLIGIVVVLVMFLNAQFQKRIPKDIP